MSQGEIADLVVGQDDHLFKAHTIATRKGSQAAREIVVQDQIPAAEDLFGQEVGETAIGRAIGRKWNYVVNIAVQHEERRGARKIQL